MNKNLLKSVLILFFLLVIIQSASALGMSGDVYPTYDFEPNKVITNTITLKASDRLMSYSLNVTGGSLAKYTTIDKTFFTDLEPGTKQPFTITIKLPSELSPGLHSVNVRAEEEPPSFNTEGTGIAAKLAMVSISKVRSFYDGKYIISRVILPEDPNIGKDINFIIRVEGWGKTDIQKTSATLEIFDDLNNSVATLSTGENSTVLKAGESLDLPVKWPAGDQKPGNYRAVATVDYDGNTAKSNDKTFKIGSKELKILSYTTEFKPNTINKFEIEVESNWNGMIKGAYADISIENAGFVKTPAIDIDSFEKATLVGYWDTAGRAAGEYNVNVVVNYEGYRTRDSFKVRILSESEVPKSSSGEGKVELGYSSIGIIVLVIVVVLGIVAYFIKNKKSQPPPAIPTQYYPQNYPNR